MLSILGFDIALIRYLPDEKDKGGMINSCFTITALAALLLSLVFLSLLNLIAPALGILLENKVYGTAFILFTIVGSLSALQASVFVAFRQVKYSFLQALVAILRVGILPFLIALGAFRIYSSIGLSTLLALITGNVLILRVLSSYRPGTCSIKSGKSQILSTKS